MTIRLILSLIISAVIIIIINDIIILSYILLFVIYIEYLGNSINSGYSPICFSVCLVFVGMTFNLQIGHNLLPRPLPLPSFLILQGTCTCATSLKLFLHGE